MAEDAAQHDGRRRRCPMLGHDIGFAYCRAPGGDIPCRRILDCWWEAFDIESFIREQYGEEMIDRILAPRQDKRVTLYELIRKAQARSRPGGEP